MENATKFLLMAGGLILGVLLFSVFAFVFRAGARYSHRIDEAQSENQMILENSKFEFYNRGSSGVNNSFEQNTISDMVSLINMVYSQNTEGYDSDRIDLVISAGPNESIKLEVPGKLRLTDDGKKLGRNQVFCNGEIISVYDLLSSEDFSGEDDLLTTSKCDNSTNNKIVYKYIFPVDGSYEYYSSGRVKKMKFKMKNLWH